MESEYGSCESELEGDHWTALHMADDVDELSRAHRSDMSSSDDEIERFPPLWGKLEFFHELQEQWPGGFFRVMGDEWEVGRKFAEGAQARIFEAERTLPDGTKDADKWVLKMFSKWVPFYNLMKQFPKGMLMNLGPDGRYSNGHSCSIYGVMMRQDGRIAVLLKRYWGDLRTLIDHRMVLKSNQDLPFPDMSIVRQILLDIALGMKALHADGILHRDLRASNVLIWPLGDDYDPIHGGKFKCHVADFETSVGVLGTSFWRAPEILSGFKSRRVLPDLFTEKSDVYSFAMTCYEILTGRIPFEEHHINDYDLVLRGTRPELPESIDLWLKELLRMCWHQDPLQRPSFEEIVDILQARSVEVREHEILAPRSSTWEELHDPRVRSHQDPAMENLEKFPILVEMLAGTLQCCEEEVRKMKSCKDQVDMFKSQCAHLVTSLSSDAEKVFQRFQQVLEILKEPMITNAHRQRIALNYWFKCVAFGIHSLVDLTRNLQMVVKMLAECGAKDWWKTTLRYSTTPPHPQIPRWSIFDLALQQCQWSMDIAHFAINKINELATGFGGWLSRDPGFQWCPERQRAVLLNLAELSGSFGIAATLEAQDRDELFKNLEMFLYKNRHEPYKNEYRLASFLMAKLAGPVPEASYVPYSFQIDPPVNLVSRSPVTAIWCDKILCHVKKVKAEGYEVRKVMEMDAAPLAAVQHPNVVRLIGCFVQTSRDVIGLTKILTKVCFAPFKNQRDSGWTGVLVMELMEGDLRKLMDQRCPNPGPRSRPFPLIVALDIMLQIAEAMRFVHEHKILHRDLKTTNILFSSTSTRAVQSYPTLDLDHIRELQLLYLLTPERFYTVKVADFGLAKYSPTESSHILDANIGTARYMAPEMFYNSEAEVPSEYNWSCDVYSFAMTCSAILTGNEPFHFVENSTRTNVMASVVQDQVRPDLGLGGALPSLKALIERCWDKDPLRRPPFSEICKELWDCKVEATISCLRRR